MLESAGNVGGGLDSAEEAALTANATGLNNFLGGGGLFSQANSYGFLSTLVPSLTVNDDQSSNISLTASGSAAFPSLTNADLSAGPFHASFSNTGAIPILAIGRSDGGQAIIIGSSGGTITAPTNPTTPTGVPEPTTIALLSGLALAGAMTRRRRSAATA